VSGHISEAIERWADEVALLGGSEPLTRYRDLKSGTLDLQGADPEVRKRLLDGDPVRVSRLFPHDPIRTAAGRSAQRLADRLWALESGHSLAAGYLATGLATWNDRMSARRPMVPILLRRLQALPTGPAESDVMLQVVGEPELNELLLAAMADQLGIRLTPQDLLDPSGDLRYPVVVDRLREQAPPHIVDGFLIHHRAVVGAMSAVPAGQAAEMRRRSRELASAPLVALAAGAAPEPVIRSTEDDTALTVPPLDLDAAQAAVLADVRAGRSLAVEAPAGTGAVQVVAGICADAVDSGRTVLVVAEAAPRLQAVRRRLGEIGLGGATLDLSDGLVTAPGIARDVLATLDAAAATSLPQTPTAAGTHPSTHDQAVLARHHDAMHRQRQPWGRSAYEAISAAMIGAPHALGVRLGRADLEHLDEATLDHLRTALAEFVDLDGLRVGPDATVWFGAAPATDTDAERAVGLVQHLRAVVAPAARELTARAAAEVGMPAPAGPAEAAELVALLDGVAEVESTFDPAVWAAPVDRLAAATADRRSRRARPDSPGLRERRGLRAQADQLARPSARDDTARLSAALDQAAGIARVWNARCRDGRLPRTGDSAAAAAQTVHAMQAAVLELSAVHPDALPPDLDFPATQARLAQLADDADWARRLPRLNMAATVLADAGLGPLVAALRDRVESGERVDAAAAAAALDACVAASIAQDIQVTDEVLSHNDAEMLRETSERWRHADAGAVVGRSQQVRQAWLARVRRAATERPVQLRSLRDAASGRSPRTVRELMASAGDTVHAGRPIWLAGPLSAADSLPPVAAIDVLVVLDAQGVALAHAIGVLARARQAVVVGDPQLPPPAPTPISVEAPDPQVTAPLPGSVVEAPSVLAVLRDQLPTHRLAVRYGCRDERLHAVLPQTRWSAALSVPPGPVAQSPVAFDRVEQVPGSRDQEETVTPEVTRVVELVRRHLAERPGRGLAVLTLGRAHADALRSALARACLAEPAMAEALGPDTDEPFLLRTVDELHGERRDAVILSVGFGRTVDGRLLYRFGPLNRPGGVRWLAAAVATARSEITVVSSIAADELEPRRLAADGLRALRDVLAAAEGVELGETAQDGVAARPAPAVEPALEPALEPAPAPAPGSTRLGDAFVQSLRAGLRAAGLPVAAGGGTGALAVPLVLEHPGRPGRGLVAIDTDGGAYRDLATVRDRERMRPEHLLRSGWAVHRVCCVAWAQDADAEVQALRAVWRRAQADADAQDAARNAPPTPSETSQDGPAPAEPAVRAPGESEPGESEPGESEPASAGGPRRPAVVRGRPIESYPASDLTAVAGWLESTAAAPSEDAAVAALAREVGLAHPSARADALLRQAVRASRVDRNTAVPVPDPLGSASGADSDERARERAAEDAAHEDWLAAERPPHHE
jgi:hypothetical protein